MAQTSAAANVVVNMFLFVILLFLTFCSFVGVAVQDKRNLKL